MNLRLLTLHLMLFAAALSGQSSTGTGRLFRIPANVVIKSGYSTGSVLITAPASRAPFVQIVGLSSAATISPTNEAISGISTDIVSPSLVVRSRDNGNQETWVHSNATFSLSASRSAAAPTQVVVFVVLSVRTTD